MTAVGGARAPRSSSPLVRSTRDQRRACCMSMCPQLGPQQYAVTRANASCYVRAALARSSGFRHATEGAHTHKSSPAGQEAFPAAPSRSRGSFPRMPSRGILAVAYLHVFTSVNGAARTPLHGLPEAPKNWRSPVSVFSAVCPTMPTASSAIRSAARVHRRRGKGLGNRLLARTAEGRFSLRLALYALVCRTLRGVPEGPTGAAPPSHCGTGSLDPRSSYHNPSNSTVRRTYFVPGSFLQSRSRNITKVVGTPP